MRDYRQNPPTAEDMDIYTHLLFTVYGHWEIHGEQRALIVIGNIQVCGTAPLPPD